MYSGANKSSIGSILLTMGVVTQRQLDTILLEQAKLKADHLLGKLLVAAGIISDKQLTQAVTLQQAMRSRKRTHAAVAVADLAMARQRRASVLQFRERIQDRSTQITKQVNEGAGLELQLACGSTEPGKE